VGVNQLELVLPLRACDANALADAIEHAAPDAIGYHACGCLLRDGSVPRAFPNDFATWAARELGDMPLAERLGSVDPLALGDLERVRRAFLHQLAVHRREGAVGPLRVTRNPFQFVRSIEVAVPLDLRAHSAGELRDGIAQADASAVYQHAFAARLRRDDGASDLGAWAREQLGDLALADRLDAVSPFSALLSTAAGRSFRRAGLERLRGRLLAACDSPDGPVE
jgi:Family of unknown function (DUF5752)